MFKPFIVRCNTSLYLIKVITALFRIFYLFVLKWLCRELTYYPVTSFLFLGISTHNSPLVRAKITLPTLLLLSHHQIHHGAFPSSSSSLFPPREVLLSIWVLLGHNLERIRGKALKRLLVVCSLFFFFFVFSIRFLYRLV